MHTQKKWIHSETKPLEDVDGFIIFIFFCCCVCFVCRNNDTCLVLSMLLIHIIIFYPWNIEDSNIKFTLITHYLIRPLKWVQILNVSYYVWVWKWMKKQSSHCIVLEFFLYKKKSETSISDHHNYIYNDVEN